MQHRPVAFEKLHEGTCSQNCSTVLVAKRPARVQKTTVAVFEKRLHVVVHTTCHSNPEHDPRENGGDHSHILCDGGSTPAGGLDRPLCEEIKRHQLKRQGTPLVFKVPANETIYAFLCGAGIGSRLCRPRPPSTCEWIGG